MRLRLQLWKSFMQQTAPEKSIDRAAVSDSNPVCSKYSGGLPLATFSELGKSFGFHFDRRRRPQSSSIQNKLSAAESAAHRSFLHSSQKAVAP